jgi:hypothetical protein
MGLGEGCGKASRLDTSDRLPKVAIFAKTGFYKHLSRFSFTHDL